jgi:hypothetical protein
LTFRVRWQNTQNSTSPSTENDFLEDFRKLVELLLPWYKIRIAQYWAHLQH